MTRYKNFLCVIAMGIWGVGAQAAHATFSIVACEPATGQCGIAVATHNLSVGHGVPFAVSGLGAGVSQFETNPCHMPAILKALRDGKDAEAALASALDEESSCVDGNDVDFRQIGVVGHGGTAAAYTGREAQGYSGHRAEGYVSVQGNGLASKRVLDQMWDCFHSTDGSLSERLLTALEAGQRVGGQSIGVLSAALLVSTPDGWPVDVDLRVDFAPSTAVEDLREAYDANYARQLLFRAERDEDAARSAKFVEEALKRAPDWDRIWLRAAHLAANEGDLEETARRACHFKSLNPVWAAKLEEEFDFSECE
jgi:uncharacterized Ntn-hydrolase superfamily protein